MDSRKGDVDQVDHDRIDAISATNSNTLIQVLPHTAPDKDLSLSSPSQGQDQTQVEVLPTLTIDGPMFNPKVTHGRQARRTTSTSRRRRLLDFLSHNRPTTLLRSLLLISSLLAVNLVLWITALILFLPRDASRKVLSLGVVAWTLGLRHALDADHISAIDNAIRRLLALGQKAICPGLFFSLGHSTVVIAVTIALIISTSILDHIDGVATIGGMVGTCVSASFLLVIAVVNIFVLWNTLRSSKRWKAKAEEGGKEGEGKVGEVKDGTRKPMTCLSRIARPFFKLIDRSWKMFPLGILFGLGFDTASEIALLGVSALAKSPSTSSQSTSTSATGIPNGEIILLPLLFTCGMALVDSLDSVGMLWAYLGAGHVEEEGEGGDRDRKGEGRGWGRWRRWTLWERKEVEVDVEVGSVSPSSLNPDKEDDVVPEKAPSDEVCSTGLSLVDEKGRQEATATEPKAVHGSGSGSASAAKAATMTSISVALTIVSIAVALFISIVEFMGLAASECSSCADAAANDPGLSGRWWRFWQTLNDDSGYIGAGVVGIMVFVVFTWGLHRFWVRRRLRKQQKVDDDLKPVENLES